MEPVFRLEVMGLLYVSLRPLPAEGRIRSHAGPYVGFAMDKVAVGQVFLRVLYFVLSGSLHQYSVPIYSSTIYAMLF
jgi:hypothetical protein